MTQIARTAGTLAGIGRRVGNTNSSPGEQLLTRKALALLSRDCREACLGEGAAVLYSTRFRVNLYSSAVLLNARQRDLQLERASTVSCWALQNSAGPASQFLLLLCRSRNSCTTAGQARSRHKGGKGWTSRRYISRIWRRLLARTSLLSVYGPTRDTLGIQILPQQLQLLGRPLS